MSMEKGILLTTAVATTLNALNPVNAESLEGGGKKIQEAPARQEAQVEAPQYEYVPSQWELTPEFSLESDSQTQTPRKKIDTIQNKETRLLMQGVIDDPISNDETSLRREGFEKILALHGEQKMKEFFDLLISTYPEKTQEEMKVMSEKEGVDKMLKHLSERMRTGYFSEYGTPIEQSLYQAEEIIKNGQYERIQKVVASLRELGYKKTIPLDMMTSRWVAIMEDSQEQEAFVKSAGLEKLAGINLQDKLVKAGLIPPDKDYFDLKPTDRLSILGKYLYDQHKEKPK